MNKKFLLFLIIFVVLSSVVVAFIVYKNYYGPQKPGKCLILDNKYCKLLKIREINPIRSKIEAKLSTGTKIFAPVDGNCKDKFWLIKSETEKIPGVSVSFDGDSNRTFEYTLFFSQGKCNSETIKKGDLLGSIESGTLEISIISTEKGNESSSSAKVENELMKKLISNEK